MRSTNIVDTFFATADAHDLSCDARLLYLALMVYDRRNLLGIITWNTDYISVVTRMPKKRIEKAKEELIAARLLIDGNYNSWWMTEFLSHNPLKGGNTYRTYYEIVSDVKDPDLLFLALDSCPRIPAAMQAALIDTETCPSGIEITATKEELDNARNGDRKKKGT